MKRTSDNIKEFKNGNLSIRFPIEYCKSDVSEQEAYYDMSEVLEELDCYFIGDEFCLGNSCTGIMIYNFHSDFVYIFNFDDMKKLIAGKWLKLYARTPDDDDREVINEWLDK